MRPVEETFADAREAGEHGIEFACSEDAGGSEGAGVRLRGGDLMGEQAPVEGEAALPLLEGAVEGLAEAAGPHVGWLRIRHRGFGYSRAQTVRSEESYQTSSCPSASKKR